MTGAFSRIMAARGEGVEGQRRGGLGGQSARSDQRASGGQDELS